MSEVFKKIKPSTNTIYRGDNLEILRALPDKFVDLIYIDPPFFTQRNYKNIWGDKESVFDYGDDFFDGFMDTKDFFEKHIQSDAKGLKAYLEWMRARVVELHRLLKPTGSFYLHLDHHAVHYMKVICDEIFGYNNFRNEIVWQRKIGKNSTGKARGWPNNSDYILFYTKSDKFTFEPQYIDDSDSLPESITKMYRHDDNDGKGPYQLGPMEAPSDSPTLKFKFKGFSSPRKGWRWKKSRMEEAYRAGKLYIPEDKTKQIRQKMYLKDRKGKILESLWTDIRCVQGGSKEYVGWPTQKPLALLERILSASTKEGDIVLDCFAGCGTAMHASHNLKRKWIGIDVSPTAIKVNKERLGEIGAKVNVIDENDLPTRLSKRAKAKQKKSEVA
jgi:site-specific DNA-methyltransferase (adenine-specific)